ncbi:MAG: peptidase S16 [SAR202 cluster bacterium]|nr:peptidase S16 [SAR202 cluster bacterium]
MPESRPTHYLRLFPLDSTVLFPTIELPLMVFEPRYLQLMRECTEANEPFGVQLLRRGREVGDVDVTPYDVGTTAMVRQVDRVEGGRLRVQAFGQRRYRVVDYEHDRPYLAARVEYLPDEAGNLDGGVERRVRELAHRYMQGVVALQGGYVRDIPLPHDAHTLSWVVAQLFQGNPLSQQRLLEAPTTAVRLQQELGMLEAAVDEVHRQVQAKHPEQRFSPN